MSVSDVHLHGECSPVMLHTVGVGVEGDGDHHQETGEALA